MRSGLIQPVSKWFKCFQFVNMLIQVTLISAYWECYSAILDEFLHPFHKGTGGLYGREGPIDVDTFTDSEALWETTMNWFLIRIIMALIN